MKKETFLAGDCQTRRRDGIGGRDGRLEVVGRWGRREFRGRGSVKE